MNTIKKYFSDVGQSFLSLDTSLYWLYLVYFISGIFSGEILFISQITGKRISDWSLGEGFSDTTVITTSLVALLFTLTYLICRRAWRGFVRFIKSSHPEILLIYLAGISFAFYKGGFNLEDYEKDLISLDGETLLIVCLIPFVLTGFFFINTLISNAIKKSNDVTPLFLSDDAILHAEDDCLGLSVKAERFAMAALNRGSSDSLVFGVDSPWGAGKSSFINLCIKHWDSLDKNPPLVFRFEPIRYLEQSNLAEIFANELIKEIQKVSFDPYLSTTFENYLKLLNNAKKISIFGFEFNFFNNQNLTSAFDKLQKCLFKFDRKIIVIIDDLDRLSWSESKRILYSIKQSFKLPNLSYVLCYDTENLIDNSNNNDALDIQLFLEKYINIKFSLFNDKAALAKLVSEDSDKILANISNKDVISVSYIKKALAMLQSFYSSSDYETYAYFLGDLRKVKRLINSMVLIDIHSTDFFNTDFDSQDLINLQILYLSYPSLFRRIYNSETYGGKEVYSVKLQAGKYENSERFKEILNDKNYSENEKFLLKKLFCVETLNANSNSIKERLNTATRACFNGGGFSNRNLENYLNLIVNLIKPSTTESTTSYLNKKNDFIGGQSLATVFENVGLKGVEANHAHVEILNIIGNSAEELSAEQGNEIISYILQNIQRYSFLHTSNQSLSHRNSLTYVLLKVLDLTLGNNSYRSNALIDPKVIVNEINDWIFGEGKHANMGIIFVLIDEARLPLGYYDLLLFRLYCSSDRNAYLSNIYKALSSKGEILESDSDTEIGAIRGMRLISQKIFESFDSQYIKNKRNIFDDVSALTAYQLAPAGEAFSLEEIEKTKVGILVFIIYQLTNKKIDMGVGCGYFDTTNYEEITLKSPVAGRRIALSNPNIQTSIRKRTVDGHEIFDRMNNYLFDVCFNPDLKASNFEHFVFYLLINLTKTIDIGSMGPMPLNIEYQKTLDLKKLKQYWKKNKVGILKNQFHLRSKRIVHPNYTVSYEKDLVGIYNYLDELDPTKSE